MSDTQVPEPEVSKPGLGSPPVLDIFQLLKFEISKPTLTEIQLTDKENK